MTGIVSGSYLPGAGPPDGMRVPPPRVDDSSVPHWYMYPPKALFRPVNDDVDFRRALTEVNGSVSLYIHIPFCNMHCSFCTLLTVARSQQSEVQEYLRLLQNHARLVAQSLNKGGSARISTIYVGGGTPSVLNRHQVTQLMVSIFEHFQIGTNFQGCLEFSPETTTLELAAHWRAQGFSQSSLGVQSFQDRQLRRMRRRHSGNDALRAISVLRQAQFNEINVDLIYGFPGQSEDEWIADIHAATTAGATSLTLHPLTVRSHTAFAKKPILESSVAIRGMQLAQTFLEEAGWKPTGPLSFSSSGRRNPLEWQEAAGVPTIGLGVGARSYLTDLHVASVSVRERLSYAASIDAYRAAIDTDSFPIRSSVHLNAEEQIRRYVLLTLMLGCLPVDWQTHSFGKRLPTVTDELADVISKYQHDSIIEISDTNLVLTKAGRSIASAVGFQLSSRAVQHAIKVRNSGKISSDTSMELPAANFA